jgi:F420-non-reducing hydrogenase large subunit
MYQTLDSKPGYRALATHWARLIELRYAAKRLLALCREPKSADPNIRIISRATTADGVGIPEAPGGLLFTIYMSIKKVAQALIQKGKEATEGILDMVEMAYRAYDPCFVCATTRYQSDAPAWRLS